MVCVCRFCLFAARLLLFFFFSSRRRHTRCSRDWSSDVCSSDLELREIRIREGARNESASEDLRADVLREETRGLLAVLTRRDDEDVLRLEPGEELRRLPDAGVGLLNV